MSLKPEIINLSSKDYILKDNHHYNCLWTRSNYLINEH